MRIAIASGKGGTGKTTIATSLALSLVGKWEGNPSFPIGPLYLDCDVEAPNAHLFLKPNVDQQLDVGILIPHVDEALCSHCGKCSEVCQYHAIAVLGKKTLVFPQLCHGCGSCTRMCPEGAITEKLDVMGRLERGPTPTGIDFARGILDIGEPMAVPVIRQLKSWAKPAPGQIVIVDASPGTSCPVVEAVRGVDFLLLVTEPTPFGLHDLKLAVQVAGELKIQAGVIINRCDTNGDEGYAATIKGFCGEQNLPVLLLIPFERTIAEGIAQGKTLVDIHPETLMSFKQLFLQIVSLVSSSHLLPGTAKKLPVIQK
jgi:MinD superfamily P-loop ATPase